MFSGAGAHGGIAVHTALSCGFIRTFVRAERSCVLWDVGGEDAGGRRSVLHENAMELKAAAVNFAPSG